MMVEGFIKNQKIREGHWTKPVDGKRALRIKLDNEPSVSNVESICLRYGSRIIQLNVKTKEWNKRTNELLVHEI